MPPKQNQPLELSYAFSATTAHTEHSAWVEGGAAVKEGSKGHAVGDVSPFAHCLALYAILDNATGCGFCGPTGHQQQVLARWTHRHRVAGGT